MTQEHHYDGHDLEVLSQLPNYYGWTVDIFRPFIHGKGIEVGAGSGTVSALLRSHLESLVLVEPSPNLAEILSRRFETEPKVTVINRTFEAYSRTLQDRSQDTVVLVNVLEHIEDDVLAVKEFFRILKPGGHLLLFVPAMQFLYSRLDRMLGHYRRYHLEGIRRLVEGAGFEIILAHYFDLLGVLSWWLINTVGRRTEFNAVMIGLYDRYAVPVTRSIEKLFHPPLGKNIVLVAQSPQ